MIIDMWCDHCNRETEELRCSICGGETREDIPAVVFWCPNCNIPILESHSSSTMDCPVCGNKAKYLCADLRPVFPEERLLLECVNGTPLKYVNDSVWACGSKYYINGKPKGVSQSVFESADVADIIDALAEHHGRNSYGTFNKYKNLFIEANRNHLGAIVDEACEFIRSEAQLYPVENIVISFSGGKDSTVSADLAVRALSNPYLVHIFGDTTLEFPATLEYADRFKKNHSLAIFKTARNNEQLFYDVAKIIGPPARMMRWCCSMFKTGPISRVLTSMYKNEKILTFYGIRKRESVSRSKYNRTEDNAEAIKIQRQTVSSPVFFWGDLEIWLYILSEEIDFNDAYRLGYDRVGCWCCPNNNPRAQFLSRVHMSEESKRWRSFLIEFAVRIGKPDPEVYVDEGWWKARQGGNGLAASKSVKVKAGLCANEEHAFVYALERPYSDEFEGLFTPLGIQSID
ncbi:MAG: phosphoadenosine phosphosulfate reductase family protein, partial [Raoultibacter sp.]